MELIIKIDEASFLHNGRFLLKQKKEKVSGKLKKIKDNNNYFIFSALSTKKKIKLKTGKITIFNKKGKKEGKGRIVFIFTDEFSNLKENILEKIGELESFSTEARLSFLIKYSGKRGIGGDFLLLNFNKKKLDFIIKEYEFSSDILLLSLKNYSFIRRDFLESLYNKVLQVISRREVKNGIRFGIKISEVKKKSQIKSFRLFKFILKKLEKDGKIEFYSDRVFTRRGDILTEREEEILRELEEIYSKEKFNPMDEDSLSKELGIDKVLLKKYLDILIEKKKILPVKGGFFLNDEYLQYLIRELRKMKVHKPKFKIKDFKEITGLSRKYSVPILELLDYLEITRRVGDQREILV